jgi:radical SAM protein with 4Fe4S-binding SPASM domain
MGKRQNVHKCAKLRLVGNQMGSLLWRAYPKQHYCTLFNPTTGFFARIEEPGHPEPFWSEHGPELIDISITNWCNRNCVTCYRSANVKGRHMSVADYVTIIQQAAKMDVCQVALGGGNPNQHPQFNDILKITRKEFGIIPNYTTNGRGLTETTLKATAAFCGAVAVSAYPPYDELGIAIEKLKTFGIKTNIHFVLDSISVHKAIEWLVDPPPQLLGINAIVFLNYKAVGRGSDRTRLLSRSEKYQEFLTHAFNEKTRLRIGFDSCMVSGLARSHGIAEASYDSCEAARFTMYISETLRAYPCSFMEAARGGIPVTRDNMMVIWRDSALFQKIRKKLKEPSCGPCSYLELCRGGCPAFPEINLCSETNTSTAPNWPLVRS